MQLTAGCCLLLAQQAGPRGYGLVQRTHVSAVLSDSPLTLLRPECFFRSAQ
jgi:hypothetical protein